MIVKAVPITADSITRDVILRGKVGCWQMDVLNARADQLYQSAAGLFFAPLAPKH